MPEAPPDIPLRRSRVLAARDWMLCFLFQRAPRFWAVFLVMLVACVVLFLRPPSTNYIFDEQEALLANPYVNAADDLTFGDAIHRDFWGLPPNASVGSYRPIPNFLWRMLWQVTEEPFVHHFYNLILHALNATLIVLIAYRWAGGSRPDPTSPAAVKRRNTIAWLAGALFLGSAVITEAVSGIVGIADALGGLGALCAIYALALPGWAMPIGVFASVLLGLFSKESALVCVPLIPMCALLGAPIMHPARPARLSRTLIALFAAAGAFILYVELRKRWFDSPLPSELTELLPTDAPLTTRLRHDFLIWFHQAPLPVDPRNNPLADAAFPERLGGALRVYFRGLVQVVFPWRLSGDYSYPAEPIPPKLWFTESYLGATLMIWPPLSGLALWIVSLVREGRRRRRLIQSSVAPRTLPAKIGAGLGLVLGLGALALMFYRWMSSEPLGPTIYGFAFQWVIVAMGVIGFGLAIDGPRRGGGGPSRVSAATGGLLLAAVGLVWMVVSYFPHSNIPVLLPTVRAERFWYFPIIGTCLFLAVGMTGLYRWAERRWPARGGRFAAVFILAFLMFQATQARLHALDYRDDLTFWEATKNAVPRSAKAHLNFSVMKGARGDLETRLKHSNIAIELSPDWPMAHIYAGDTLCRMDRPEEAWPHYREGFLLGKNEIGLIALAIQCLWDKGALVTHETELREMAEELSGSWFAYLAIDTLNNGKTHGGVDPQYRPRGYNEGPKKKDSDEEDGEEGATSDASGSGEGSGTGDGSGEPATSASGTAGAQEASALP